MVDKDYAWANTLEAYYAMTEANIAGKDYNSIDNYFACIGKPLTSVSAINVGGKPALHDEGAISVYSEPHIMWFGDKHLVISCYTDFVMQMCIRDRHAGGSANNTHIGFEICEDGLTDYTYFQKVYREAVELCAYLCKEYGLTEQNIICHSEGYKQGVASNHGDVTVSYTHLPWSPGYMPWVRMG